MLILSRNLGQTICVGEDVTVTIVGVQGNQVRIGVNAPKSIAVDRQEVAERKRANVPPPVRRVIGP